MKWAAGEDSDQIRYPEKGDKLFREDCEDWHYNAVIGHYGPEKGWGAYSEGYKIAGDILVRYVIENSRHQDLLIYPIVFNYRQWLELTLKMIIRDGNVLLENDIDFPITHELGRLWVLARKVILDLGDTIGLNESGKEIIDITEEITRELDVKDSGSFVFRYPEDIKKEPSIATGHEIVNIRNFSEIIDKVHSLLFGIGECISIELDNKKEWMAMQADEYEQIMRSEYGGYYE
jgi:hypothetical protein